VRFVLASGLVVLAVTLAGCGTADLADLEEYAADVLSRKSRIEPLPALAPPPERPILAVRCDPFDAANLKRGQPCAAR
jgi:Tfp pilus assembly protein PilP